MSLPTIRYRFPLAARGCRVRMADGVEGVILSSHGHLLTVGVGEDRRRVAPGDVEYLGGKSFNVTGERRVPVKRKIVAPVRRTWMSGLVQQEGRRA